MNSRERAQLRTRLRRVNMEYSMLIRDRSKEGRLIRIAALRNERQAIMSLLFGGESIERRLSTVRQPMSAVAMLHVVE
jgi:hypothetical protein